MFNKKSFRQKNISKINLIKNKKKVTKKIQFDKKIYDKK